MFLDAILSITIGNFIVTLGFVIVIVVVLNIISPIKPRAKMINTQDLIEDLIALKEELGLTPKQVYYESIHKDLNKRLNKHHRKNTKRKIEFFNKEI